MLELQDIHKNFEGRSVLADVNLVVPKGATHALIGSSGSGKTTLLRIAAQLVRPSAGKLTFSPAQTGALPATKNTGFVAHATMVYDELTAEENLLLFARLLGIPEPAKRVEALLHDVGLFERRDSLVRTFSRGMRQRVAIARALLHEPSVLLLDEPSTGLDPQGANWLAETLWRLHGAGSTILMSLHGESEISALATRGIRLDAGAVVADTQNGANLRSILTFASA